MTILGTLPPFSRRHIPALIIANSHFFGGVLALAAPRTAMTDFGLPKHITDSPQAQAMMRIMSARTALIGLTCGVLYSRGLFTELDLFIGIIGATFGVVDGLVCWSEGMPSSSATRAISGVFFAVWGFCGMSTE